MSTSNLWWHVKTCWREPVIEAASQTKDVHAAWDVLAKVMGVKDGSITAAFERAGKERVTYSHRQHTKTESQSMIICLHV